MTVTSTKRDTTSQKRDTKGRDTLARARLSFGEDVTAVTRDIERDTSGVTRDSDTRPLGRASRSRVRAGSWKKNSGPPSFDAWLAGATAEQVDAWKRRNDPDAGLPEPLRNGALEVF